MVILCLARCISISICFQDLFDQAKGVLFYFWFINILFFVFGGLFGSIGILVASLYLMGRIVYRALTSSFYWSSVDSIVEGIRGSRRKK